MGLCNGNHYILWDGGGLGLISYVWYVFHNFLPISTKHRFFPFSGIWKWSFILNEIGFFCLLLGDLVFNQNVWSILCACQKKKKIPKYWPLEFWLMFPGALFWKHSVSTLCYRCSCIQWNPAINIFQWT